MLKRELKVNFKNFIIWLGVLIVIFLFVYLMYPSILNSGKLNQIDEMMKIFPKEVLTSFNLDIASMDSVFGWIKTEGWVFVLLIMGVYSSLLGSNILLKEESEKTIEYLGCLPVSRKHIILSKVLCGLTYIILMVLLFLVFNYFALVLSGDFDKDVFFYLSLTPLFSSIVFFAIGMFISTFFRKTKKVIGLSLGIVFISYLFSIFSTISDVVDFLKYISVFTLADIRNVIVEGSINYCLCISSFVLTIIFVVLTIYRYNKKEFI